MSDGKVIVLPTGYDPENEPPAARKRKSAGPCNHRNVTLDLDSRVLTCRCGEQVDPFAWIERLSLDWQWYETRKEMAESQVRAAEKSAERRIREARNAGRATSSMPMPVGKRLAGIAREIARATGELGEAQASLAEVHLDGRVPGMADLHLQAAGRRVERARSSLAKLIRDHAKPRSA